MLVYEYSGLPTPQALSNVSKSKVPVASNPQTKNPSQKITVDFPTPYQSYEELSPHVHHIYETPRIESFDPSLFQHCYLIF